MIKKCISIKNVGRFVEHKAKGQQQFEKVTLVYAPNGNGKTTLADIFRSLTHNEGDYIQARHTIGSEESAQIKILTADGIAKYEDGSWDDTTEDNYPIEIFDDTFVHENVFAGDLVEHRQKTNLFQFMIGEKGVMLANREQEINKELSDVKKKLSETKLQIKHRLSSSLGVDTFVHLNDVSAIDEQIGRQQQTLNRLKKTKTIDEKEQLNKIEIPVLPIDVLKELLELSLEDVSSEAEEKVQAHLEKNLDGKGEAWIEQGLSYVTSDEDPCPFCGQKITGADLIRAYQSHFDDSYEELKSNIRNFDKRISQLLSERALSSVQTKISDNTRLIDFWSDYIDEEYKELSFLNIQEAWIAVREALNSALNEKASQPLKSMALSDELGNAIRAYTTLDDTLSKHNKDVEAINDAIDKVKKSTEEGDWEKEKSTLAKLKDKKLRFENDDVVSACTKYRNLTRRKKTLDERLQEVRKKSKEHAEKIFTVYRDAINKHLKKVGARFEIGEMKINRQGYSPSNQYQIIINDEEIDLGSENTPTDTPRFKTALSAGDKHTLAFCFFLARMESEDISDKIVVFDDPVTSLDLHREEYACQEILKVAKRAKQTIILSHRPELLHLLDTDDRNRFDTQLLQIDRVGRKSNITPWDKRKTLRDDYKRDYHTLTGFLDGHQTNRLTVLRAIRPLLEKSLEYKYPRHLFESEGLGDHISRIRKSDDDSPLANMKPFVEDLDDLHQFSKKYMHGRSAGSQPPKNMLEGYAEQALEIIHR